MTHDAVRIGFVVGAVVSFWAVARDARAEACPGARISADVGGKAGHLDVTLRSDGGSDATLTAVDSTGAKRTRWRTTFDFAPHLSFVDARLRWAAFVGAGSTHQLVVVNAGGEIVMDYSLLDLGLTDAERANGGKKRKGCSAPWADDAKFSESQSGSELFIDLPSGKRLVVVGASGELRSETTR